MPGKRKGRLSKTEATQIFRDAFQDGRVLLTKHVRERMQERDIDALDIEGVASSGLVLHEPEPDINTGDLKYTITCPRTEIRVVFIICPNDERDRRVIRLVTVFKGS